jgi:hypothetical protein
VKSYERGVELSNEKSRGRNRTIIEILLHLTSHNPHPISQIPPTPTTPTAPTLAMQWKAEMNAKEKED